MMLAPIAMHTVDGKKTKCISDGGGRLRYITSDQNHKTVVVLLRSCSARRGPGEIDYARDG